MTTDNNTVGWELLIVGVACVGAPSYSLGFFEALEIEAGKVLSALACLPRPAAIAFGTSFLWLRHHVCSLDLGHAEYHKDGAITWTETA